MFIPLYSSLNLYLIILWILDFKYILLLYYYYMPGITSIRNPPPDMPGITSIRHPPPDMPGVTSIRHPPPPPHLICQVKC